MSLDATAQALVTDPVATESEETPEKTEDEMLSDAYDRLTADGVDEESEPEQVEEPEEEKEEGKEEAKEDDAEKEVSEAPTDLPAGIKEAWKDIPETARQAIVASQRDLSKKLADQGRVMQGLNPVKSALEQAAKDLPHMMNMTPDAIAKDVFNLAKMSHEFNTKPVETIMGLIKQHNMGEAVSQALSGQDVTDGARQTASLHNEIASLKKQLEQVSDPSRLRETFNSFTAETQAVSEVQAFSGAAEHWSQVEEYMPDIIPIARNKLGAGASPKDVLSAAYDLAVNIYLPETKAQAQPAEQAPAAPDPAKTEAAKKAKSVNVTSRATGKTREKTEEELLSEAYDRASNK